MRVFASSAHRRHDPPAEVSGGPSIPAWEVPQRAEVILTAVREAGHDIRMPRELGERPIVAVHDAAMLRYLESAWREWQAAGTGRRPSSRTPCCKTDIGRAWADRPSLTRPAGASAAGASIGWWQGRRPGGHPGCDFHHGNGTQQLFYDRADVAYASLHADPARMYPDFSGYASETGTGDGVGGSFNQPLAAGTGDTAYSWRWNGRSTGCCRGQTDRSW